MDEFPRRAFCALLAASAGTVSGCNFMGQRSSTGTEESIAGGTVVKTRAELETAFEDLSPGDTIRISDENAPYRTTQWLDIDVDGVTIIGPGIRDLIRPADDANVGGIRVGHHERCQEIDIRGVGYHGNGVDLSETLGLSDLFEHLGLGDELGLNEDAERLHGIAVRDAANVTIERNYVRNTYPRRQGDGGSGISVTRHCSDVRIINNRVHEWGYQGIEFAGKRLAVSGNVVTNGAGQPISCDMWYPSGKNHTPQGVAVYGNLLGNTFEGSLTGVARNEPLAPNEGYVSIFGNVGFGYHKSFCHVRGPKPLKNVSVQNNVSIQETDGLAEDNKKYAGVAVDVASGRNLSIKNNEFHGYSGHGIHVKNDVRDVSIQNNSISESGLSGIRLVGVSESLIGGNHVVGTTNTGIRLHDTSDVAVRNNHVREAGGVGIALRGSGDISGNDVAANHVTGNGKRSKQPVPAIRVRDVGALVQRNVVRQNGAPAIVEGDGAGNNFYRDNWADGEDPWQFTSATSRVRGHSPPVDVHRGVSADAESNVVRVDFDRPYAHHPRLTFGRMGGGIADVSFGTDSNDNYVGADITVSAAGGVVDVFVDVV